MGSDNLKLTKSESIYNPPEDNCLIIIDDFNHLLDNGIEEVLVSNI